MEILIVVDRMPLYSNECLFCTDNDLCFFDKERCEIEKNECPFLQLSEKKQSEDIIISELHQLSPKDKIIIKNGIGMYEFYVVTEFEFVDRNGDAMSIESFDKCLQGHGWFIKKVVRGIISFDDLIKWHHDEKSIDYPITEIKLIKEFYNYE